MNGSRGPVFTNLASYCAGPGFKSLHSRPAILTKVSRGFPCKFSDSALDYATKALLHNLSTSLFTKLSRHAVADQTTKSKLYQCNVHDLSNLRISKRIICGRLKFVKETFPSYLIKRSYYKRDFRYSWRKV
jgi:hypothetical protein